MDNGPNMIPIGVLVIFFSASILAVIFQVSAVAFTLLKLIGAAYLVYLAVMAFRASAAKLNGSERDALPLGKLYRRGIIMNITNPKVSIFFLAFLPQFADPQRGSLWVQVVLLGLVFIASTALIFGAVSVFAGFLGDRLKRSPKAQVVMNRIAGTVYTALALKLVTAQRQNQDTLFVRNTFFSTGRRYYCELINCATISSPTRLASLNRVEGGYSTPAANTSSGR